MRTTKTLLVLFFLKLFFLINTFGQPLFGTEEEILLWGGVAPGSENLSITENIIIRDLEGTCTSNRAAELVTTPSIIPYIADTPNGAAVVICPGGAYKRVVIDVEGSDIAKFLNNLGISAFVVKYRLPKDNHLNNKYVTLTDAQRAMRYVRSNAAKWNIDVDKIGIMGASAGGHMATTLATKYDQMVYTPIDAIDSISAKANFMMLLYPVVTMESATTHLTTRTYLLGDDPSQDLIDEFSAEKNVTSESPITFFALANDDGSVSPQNSIQLSDALTALGVANEINIYSNGGHGKGICKAVGYDFESWPEDCKKWLIKNSLTDSLHLGITSKQHNKVTIANTITNSLNSLRFKLPKCNTLTILVSDLQGSKVTEFSINGISEGEYTFDLSPTTAIARGIYIIKVKTDNLQQTFKIVLQ